jgi:hypothetical protein
LRGSFFSDTPPCTFVERAADAKLDIDKVLMAIEELRRWQRRALEMSRASGGGGPEEAARVKQQIAYYEGLLQDMKRRANPDSAPRVMRRFG